MTLTVGSLFSGIGGFDLGLERAGMKVVWQVENDPFCNKVLGKHWPNVQRFGDIKDCGKHNLEPVDLICGGFPCQDVSVAGKRKGLDGERSGLWSEYARIIRELRPRYVLVENVPGLLSSGFGRVLGDLAESGHDAEWSCFSACMFGAPHSRERVFLVAYPNKKRRLPNGIYNYTEHQVSPRSSHWKTKTFTRGWSDVECWFESIVQDCNRSANSSDHSRMDNGIPAKLDLDRIGALGNAVVPQIAEFIGRQIMKFEDLA